MTHPKFAEWVRHAWEGLVYEPLRSAHLTIVERAGSEPVRSDHYVEVEPDRVVRREADRSHRDRAVVRAQPRRGGQGTAANRPHDLRRIERTENWHGQMMDPRRAEGPGRRHLSRESLREVGERR